MSTLTLKLQTRKMYFGFALWLSSNMVRSAVKVPLNTLVCVSKTIIVSRSGAIKSLFDRLAPWEKKKYFSPKRRRLRKRSADVYIKKTVSEKKESGREKERELCQAFYFFRLDYVFIFMIARIFIVDSFSFIFSCSYIFIIISLLYFRFYSWLKKKLLEFYKGFTLRYSNK